MPLFKRFLRSLTAASERMDGSWRSRFLRYKAGCTKPSMKIARNRRAISQSLDLFIIIAAVLAVGGIVTAAVFSLAGSATTNSFVGVVQVQAAGGTVTGAINSFSITVKNTGSSTITGIMTITLGGTTQPATPVTLPAPTGSDGTWALGGAATFPVQLTGTTVTLTPGEQVAVSQGAITGLTTGWTIGTKYTVTVAFGSAQQSITVTA